MIAEAGQVAAEAAKSGTINIAIPTAVVTSILTGLAVKVPDMLARMRGKPRTNGNGGPKPGMGDECLKHRDALVAHGTKLDNLDQTLARYENYFKDILTRLPK